MSILNNIQGSGFKTPKNYFNSLESRICAQASKGQNPANMQVPEGYFEGLEDTIMKAVTKDAVLDKNKGSGMSVPEGYLNTLEETISAQIIKKDPKVISLFTTRNLLYASSIAAAILILFNLFINQDKTTFENLDVELVENYIINQDLDSYELASLLNDEDLNTENFIDSDIFSEAVEDYLMDNTDIEELINEQL